MSPEQHGSFAEKSSEFRKTPDSRLELANNQLNSTPELSPKDIEARAEHARKEALESAISADKETRETKKDNSSHERSRRLTISKKEREATYNRTLKHIQSDMNAASRTFSKVIHNKTVENISEVTGKTLARPNAILAGSICSFILTIAAYAVSKTMGYVMSGSETIFAFILGWVIGIVYDYLRILFTGRS